MGFLETFKQKMASPEAANERGKNNEMKFIFSRHERPGKTPEGTSADYITPDGLQNAYKRGLEEKSQYVLITGSKSVNRARETGESYMQGIDDEGLVEVINKEGKEGTKLSEYGVYAMSDLNPIQNAGKIFPKLVAEGIELAKKGEIKEEEIEGYAISKYITLPEETFKAEGIPTLREVAGDMAHRLSSGIKMSSKLFEGLDVDVVNFTHGPKLETFLKYVLVKDGKTGIETTDDIGGYIKPGESIEFDIKRDGEGNLLPIKINIRGQEYEFDMDEFNKLVDEYKERKINEKK